MADLLIRASAVAQGLKAALNDVMATKDVVRIAAATLPSAPVAVDWTQAGDGVLLADADGNVMMWQLRRDMPAPAPASKPLGGAAAKQFAEARPPLSVTWHVDAKQAQVITA